jgi:hypothetical protein
MVSFLWAREAPPTGKEALNHMEYQMGWADDDLIAG